MTDVIQAPIVVHNLHGGPEKVKARRHRIIDLFLNSARGGLGGFNELRRSDRRYMRKQAKKRGLNVFVFGKNGAVWDPTLLRPKRKRIKKILTGGYVGADGVATARLGDDDRRVGPNRFAIYIEFDVMVVGLNFEFVVTHLMARSFTLHKWRQRLFRRQLNKLSDGVQKKDGVLVGDMNSPDYINLPDMLERPVKTPASHGKRKYDQMITWGAHIEIEDVDDVNTPSDHDMIKGVIKFFRKPRRRLLNGR